MDRRPEGTGGERKPPQKGILSSDRVVWLDLPKVQFVLFENDSADDYKEIDGSNTMHLTIRAMGRNKATNVKIDLTGCTLAEITALQEMLNKSLEIVKPRVKRLDEFAQEGFQNGTEVYERVYRPVPRVHEKQRKPE